MNFPMVCARVLAGLATSWHWLLYLRTQNRTQVKPTIRTYACTQAHPPARAHSHTNAHSHARTRARSHTHTHTHTHKYLTSIPSQLSRPLFLMRDKNLPISLKIGVPLFFNTCSTITSYRLDQWFIFVNITNGKL